jgi:hypothetical protein
VHRLPVCALCEGLREPDSPLEPSPTAEDEPADDDQESPSWTWWANSADPADREVGHAMWSHLHFRAEELRAWAGVPLDATPYPRPPTEAEAGLARALAAWIGDLEARGVQVEQGYRGPDDDVGPDVPDEETYRRLLLLGTVSIHDVDVPLLFGTPAAPDVSDVLALPVPPVAYCPADDWEGERLELAPLSTYDEHPPTGHRRVPSGPAPAPGYVRTTRAFPPVAQAVLMADARMAASQITFSLKRLLEKHAREAGIPVAYVRDADGAVTEETLDVVCAAFLEVQADWEAFGERLIASAFELRAAPQLFVAV